MASDKVKSTKMDDTENTQLGGLAQNETGIPENLGLIEEAPSARMALAAAFPEALGAEDVPDFELPRLARPCNNQFYGTCVAESLERLVEYYNQDEADTSKLSPRDIYSQCKKVDNYPYQGTYFSVAHDVLKKLGVVKSELYPEDYSNYDKYIKTFDDRTSAQQYRSKGYVLMNNWQEAIRFVFANQKPCHMGVNGNNPSWTHQAVVANDNTVLPWNSDLGNNWGHAILLVGKKTINGVVYLILENSWGSWADNGRAKISTQYSGIQNGFYGLYDLPNNWQNINDEYLKEKKMMTFNHAMQIVVNMYRSLLLREPKAEERQALIGHANKLAYEVNRKNEAGVRQFFDGFKDEMKIKAQQY